MDELKEILKGIEVYGGIIPYFEAQRAVSVEYARSIELIFLENIRSLIKDNYKDLSDNQDESSDF